MIANGSASRRQSILLNSEELPNRTAVLRADGWKLIVGNGTLNDTAVRSLVAAVLVLARRRGAVSDPVRGWFRMVWPSPARCMHGQPQLSPQLYFCRQCLWGV